VTSKLQVTIPKTIADEFGIVPGSELKWVAAGDSIRVLLLEGDVGAQSNSQERLRSFDRATARQRERNTTSGKSEDATNRGWTRDDLYARAGSR
jgi:bifunctional DNA-binding transcriptional regulator/antitoxin component of YhaV-PrlF toxin-antitoxin module